MPRKPLPRVADAPYHVTARTNNRDWFGLPLDEVWDIFSIHLEKVNRRYSAQIGAFVLMPNHFHLLIRTPDANLGDVMNHLQREVSRRIAKQTRRINHIFGGPYKGSLIASGTYLYHAYKYVYRNPIEAGLSLLAEDYPYSTLKNAFGEASLPYPLADKLMVEWSPIPVCLKQRREWLNTSYKKRELEVIRKGLRRVSFCFPSEKKFKSAVSSLLQV